MKEVCDKACLKFILGRFCATKVAEDERASDGRHGNLWHAGQRPP
jgi:hypothetical protein